MKLNKLIQTSAIILVGVFSGNAAADDATINRYELKNGIRVVIVHVPGAARQTTLTFLPLSLSTDPANRGQWSHLLEHMLIRSTDPVDLNPEGLQLNGETMPEYLRLDSYAMPDHWRESVERHAKWIAARSFDAETLAREKKNIAGEEQTVSEIGFTHKFAVAGWNQVVRHGLQHAAVHGDIADAEVKEVEAYAKRNISIDESILVASIGPTDPKELIKGIRETIGEVPQSKLTAKTIDNGKKNNLEGEFQATWDVPVKHFMLWWKLPDTSLETRMAANVAGNLLVGKLHRKFVVPFMDIKPLVYPALILPEGDFLLVNLSMPDELDVKQVEQMVLEQAAGLSKMQATITQYASMRAKQIELPSDFAKLRKQYGARTSDYLEGNILLQLVQLKYILNTENSKISEALRLLTKESISAVTTTLQQPPTGTLLLLPQGSE